MRRVLRFLTLALWQSLAALPAALAGDLDVKLSETDGITVSPTWFLGRDDAPPPLDCPSGTAATTVQFTRSNGEMDIEDYITSVARKETICDVFTPSEPASLLAFKESGDASAWPAAGCSGTASPDWSSWNPDTGQYDHTPICDLDAGTDGTAECPDGCAEMIGWTAAESSSVCDWTGVECAGARVTSVQFTEWEFGTDTSWLSGDISLLAGLPELRRIDVHGTAAWGSIEVRKQTTAMGLLFINVD